MPRPCTAPLTIGDGPGWPLEATAQVAVSRIPPGRSPPGPFGGRSVPRTTVTPATIDRIVIMATAVSWSQRRGTVRPASVGTVIGHRRRPTTHRPPTRSPEPLDGANVSVLARESCVRKMSEQSGTDRRRLGHQSAVPGPVTSWALASVSLLVIAASFWGGAAALGGCGPDRFHPVDQ